MDHSVFKDQGEGYTATADAVRRTRIAVQGNAVVKSSENIDFLLGDPFPHITDAGEKAARIQRYQQNAEFDDAPERTLSALTGAIFRKETTVQPERMPGRMSGFLDNVDGDGSDMKEFLKLVTSEVLQMNYVFVLAEYPKNETGAELTREQAQRLGIQPMAKVYPRESIYDATYADVNGRRQLDFILLYQHGTTRNENLKRVDRESWLALYLKDGVYTQRELVKEDGRETLGEEVQPKANGSTLDYIPGEMIIHTPNKRGELPLKLGYLHAVCEKSLHRFRAYADYKECLWLNGAPATVSEGWTTQAQKLWEEMTGLTYLPSGPGLHYPLPEGVTFDIKGWNAGESAYETYLDRNEKELKAAGASFDTGEVSGEETAKAATIRNAAKSGVLSDVVDCVERGVAKVFSYCALFAGVNVEPEITINRDFVDSVLTPQERAQIQNEVDSGIIDLEEGLLQLKRGNSLVGDVTDILNRVAMGAKDEDDDEGRVGSEDDVNNSEVRENEDQVPE